MGQLARRGPEAIKALRVLRVLRVLLGLAVPEADRALMIWSTL